MTFGSQLTSIQKHSFPFITFCIFPTEATFSWKGGCWDGWQQQFSWLVWRNGSAVQVSLAIRVSHCARHQSACVPAAAAFIVGSFIAPVNRPILGTCYWEGGERGRKSVTTWRTLREELENSNQTPIMLLMHGALFSFLIFFIQSFILYLFPQNFSCFYFSFFYNLRYFFFPLHIPKSKITWKDTHISQILAVWDHHDAFKTIPRLL